MLTVSSVNQALAGFWPEWHVEQEIGEGAHGIVYRAASGTEEAAIKVLRIPQNQAEVSSFMAEGNNEATTRTYFLEIVNHYIDEVRIMEKLKDEPNIVQIRDYIVDAHEGEIGWDIYIRMELLTPFQDYISGTETDQDMVIRLGVDICKALRACAEYKIIHRDIKPENIFVGKDGTFKLGDFGIARQLERKTASLSQKGTYNYMAPEVLRSEGYTENVDVYSLGVVLFRLMNNNRIPFLDPYKQLVTYQERQDAFERRITGEELPDPVNASPAMTAVIKKACRYAPEDRYQTAGEMLAALEQLKTLQENDVKAVQKFLKSQEKPDKKGVGKQANKAVAVLAALLLAAGGLYFYNVNTDKTDSNQDSTAEIINEETEEKTEERPAETMPEVMQWHDEAIKSAVYDALDKNPDEDVYISEMNDIEMIDAVDSGAENISDLSYCHHLETLSLGDNKISDLSPLSQLTTLKELTIENNQISDLSPLKNLEDLESIDIRENDIEDLLPLAAIEGLELIIDIEQYSSLKQQLTAMHDVVNLYIEAVDKNDENEYDLTSLSEMEQLQGLSISGVHVKDTDWIESLNNLNDLRVSAAGLTRIPEISRMNHLEYLFLDENELISLEELPALENIKYLDLSHNKIRDIENLGKLTSLMQLEMNSNEISDLSEIENLYGLQYLNLEDNKISSVDPLSNLNSLMELYLAGNDIEDFSPIQSLERLKNDPEVRKE